MIEPLVRNETVLAFLAGRRSRPPKFLIGPGPDRAALSEILRLALRVPDHGKLEPWRLIVLGPEARAGLAEAARGCDPSLADPEKAAGLYADAPAMVAVLAAPVAGKIPEIEQILSAGALAYGVVLAALAAGWGASWQSGALSHDPGFAARIGAGAGERVVGLVVIGTERAAPPERDRPDLERAVTWRA